MPLAAEKRAGGAKPEESIQPASGPALPTGSGQVEGMSSREPEGGEVRMAGAPTVGFDTGKAEATSDSGGGQTGEEEVSEPQWSVASTMMTVGDIMMMKLKEFRGSSTLFLHARFENRLVTTLW